MAVVTKIIRLGEQSYLDGRGIDMPMCTFWSPNATPPTPHHPPEPQLEDERILATITDMVVQIVREP